MRKFRVDLCTDGCHGNGVFIPQYSLFTKKDEENIVVSHIHLYIYIYKYKYIYFNDIYSTLDKSYSPDGEWQ